MRAMSRVRAWQVRLVSRKERFIADQRGAVALEMPFVALFLMASLFLPLADVAIAGFKFISGWQAVRGFGQSIQYSPPPDLTNTTDWAIAARAKADSRYPIPSIQVICGDSGAACSTANITATPKYYSYTTTVTLSPLVLRSVLCTSGVGDGCTFTLRYSTRFQ